MAIKTVGLLGAGANWSMGPLALCEAINNALEVDLYGQVASEASAGRQISGTGGYGSGSAVAK